MKKHEKKGIAIITEQGEEWSMLPWFYGVSYDIFEHPEIRVVWLPIPLNMIVRLLRIVFHWAKSAGGQWSFIDSERYRAFMRGRESVFSANDGQTILDALDAVGLALARHKHKWTQEERKKYDQAHTIIKKWRWDGKKG